MKRIIAAMFVLVGLGDGASARAADDCAIDDAAIQAAGGYGAAVEAAVRTARGCEAAYATLKACHLGSLGDNALASIVKAQCEPLFAGNADAKRAYRTALARCDAIARRKVGTMFQGLAAVCRAKAARDFARK
jgi:hypothetical protein